ncbi:hypothetical protein U1Q18_004842, partial [Sarracenia purpurea var. burkii]
GQKREREREKKRNGEESNGGLLSCGVSRAFICCFRFCCRGQEDKGVSGSVYLCYNMYVSEESSFRSWINCGCGSYGCPNYHECRKWVCLLQTRFYRANSKWTLALICFVVSWFTFVIAFLLLLTGAALNDQHGEETMYFGNYYCYVVKPGVFAGAAVLSLATVVLGIVYYLALKSAKNNNDSWVGPPPPNQIGNAGIAMGQPQFPPPSSQAPVFVHEDTYMRRQFT